MRCEENIWALISCLFWLAAVFLSKSESEACSLHFTSFALLTLKDLRYTCFQIFIFLQYFPNVKESSLK